MEKEALIAEQTMELNQFYNSDSNMVIPDGSVKPLDQIMEHKRKQ